jgi:hypothetical protein
MSNIDLIYYTATSTDGLGSTTITTAQEYIPFLDWLMVFLTFVLAVALTWFGKEMMYPRTEMTKVKKIRVINY